jgi:hypothetical protein
VLRPYGLTKWDLKPRDSKAPRRNIPTKRAGNLAHAEAAVATGVVIIRVYRGHEEMVTRKSFLLYTPYVGDYKP